MSKEIRATVTDEEYAEISAYVSRKKRWHKVGHFLRDAAFQLMERNPVGGHSKSRGAVLHRASGGDSGGES